MASLFMVGFLLWTEHGRMQYDRAAAPVQQRRAAPGGARRGLVGPLGLDDEPLGAEHLAAEVPEVGCLRPDRSVDAAQFGEGEWLRHEAGGQGGVPIPDTSV